MTDSSVFTLFEDRVHTGLLRTKTKTHRLDYLSRNIEVLLDPKW